MSELAAVPAHDDLDGVRPPPLVPALHGRAEAWRELTSAFRSGRMHHAWLLQGERGIGKATTAFAFGRYALGGPDAMADGEASDPVAFRMDAAAVRQIAQGSHPGFFHLGRPASERGEGFKTQITVDEVRRLNQFFQSTAGGTWRIALVDPADDMNRNAANALLKTLEEPPPRSVFLIVNHMPGALLPTIRSRCRVLRFEPLESRSLDRIVRDELPDTSEADRLAAVRAAAGRAREAFLILTSGGLEIEAQAERLYRAETADWVAIHGAADALVQRGREAAWALFRDALLGRLAEDAKRALADDQPLRAERFASFWQGETARWREAAAYNLDRKQTILTFFQKLQALRQRSEGPGAIVR